MNRMSLALLAVAAFNGALACFVGGPLQAVGVFFAIWCGGLGIIEAIKETR